MNVVADPFRSDGDPVFIDGTIRMRRIGGAQEAHRSIDRQCTGKPWFSQAARYRAAIAMRAVWPRVSDGAERSR